eukprot:4938704-Prymnesium_polylepis.1
MAAAAAGASRLSVTAAGLLGAAGLAIAAYTYCHVLKRVLRNRPSPSSICESADQAAAALEEQGVATLAVSAAAQQLHAHCFASAKFGLDVAADGTSPLAISPNADSAHVSGVHRAGELSQYNVCREGLVFSDGGRVDLGDAAFTAAMDAFFDSALEHAAQVLGAVERRLSIGEGWFEASYGPIRDHSQWHLKRYRPELSPVEATCSDGRRVLLPVHSDPSLISSELPPEPQR